MGCLLDYALESHWHLTEEGWKKVEAFDSLELRPHIGILDLEPHSPQTRSAFFPIPSEPQKVIRLTFSDDSDESTDMGLIVPI